jgi:hypothetical protein
MGADQGGKKHDFGGNKDNHTKHRVGHATRVRLVAQTEGELHGRI